MNIDVELRKRSSFGSDEKSQPKSLMLPVRHTIYLFEGLSNWEGATSTHLTKMYLWQAQTGT